MFCKYCGSEIDSDSLFCSKCGKKLIDNKKSETSREVHSKESMSEKVSSRKSNVLRIILQIVIGIVFLVLYLIVAGLILPSGAATKAGSAVLCSAIYGVGVILWNKSQKKLDQRNRAFDEQSELKHSTVDFSIPPEESVTCPHCGYETYKNKSTCEWCGGILAK